MSKLPRHFSLTRLYIDIMCWGVGLERGGRAGLWHQGQVWDRYTVFLGPLRIEIGGRA